MAHRSGDVAAVRSARSTRAENGLRSTPAANNASAAGNYQDRNLPQCKIKRNYSCGLCPFFSQNPRSFLYHSRDVHLDRIKIYECTQCLYASKHSQKLQRHVNMIHINARNRVRRVVRSTRADKKKEPKPVKPRMAAATQSTSRRRVKNENRGNDLSSIPMEESGNDEYDDQYVNEEELLDKALKCSICSFLTRSPALMRKHEKVAHFKKRFFRCNKCSYVTHVKARYTKHVKYHSMPMIKCDLCDFRTPYKWNLDRHYKNHCGSGAFQCAKCNFRADIKQSLTVHEMNHHIPPVGKGAVMVRRRNKVGASETLALESENIDKEELELLRMEREDSALVENVETEPKQDGGKIQEKRGTGKRNLQHLRNLPLSCKRESINHNLQTDFIHPDDIVPRYGQIYVKTLKCKFCSYKAVFDHEISRHEKRVHNYVQPEPKKEKLPGRPPPKLIPLQSKVSATPPTSPILKIPALRNKVSALHTTVKTEDHISPCDKSVNEKEFSEMCKKSCLTSSLKDFVSLIGDEEGLKTIPDPQSDIDLECKTWMVSCDDEVRNSEEANKKKQTDLLKKKNASFFDKLKEKLLTSTNENFNLICDYCGYESKCLSEAAAHQKRHFVGSRSDSEGQAENDIILTGGELSSTRCQHCRQRCKTSTDLINHLKSCKAFVAAYDQQPKIEVIDIDVKEENTGDEDSNSMENRVFVWNDVPHMYDNMEEEEELEETEMDSPETPCNEEGFDTDGTVTSKGAEDTESGTQGAEDTESGTQGAENTESGTQGTENTKSGTQGAENTKPRSQGAENTKSGTQGAENTKPRSQGAENTESGTQEAEDTESGTQGTENTKSGTQGAENTKSGTQGAANTKSGTQGAENTKPRSQGAENSDSDTDEDDGNPRLNLATIKKVFKCPHCSFWASTASRFHVHIVGHLNKKPFECSLCMYRSNWRWDITKHIRLKSARDPSHSEAKVNMTDETGRRNYSKYNKYLIMMRVHEPSADSSGTGRRSKGLDVTQGIANENDIIQLPAPPALTRAPSPKAGNQVPHGTPLRPPPPLKAAHEVIPPSNCKKTLWKCKKCSFRNPNKDVVLSHVKEHYGKINADSSAEAQSPAPEDTQESYNNKSLYHKNPPYRCGHCHQVSNWKHVIQRHCRLKHNGSVLIELDWKEDCHAKQLLNLEAPDSSEEISLDTFSCNICPFTTDSEGDLTAHKLNHVDRPGSIFKCTNCPFYVPSKTAVLEHMEVHRIESAAHSSNTKFDKNEPNGSKDLNKNKTEAEQKRYRCRQCPYVSNSKTQFLYHKQFHKPRKSPFKCTHCSYNVSRRHLLHQHVRVHENAQESQGSITEAQKSDSQGSITEAQKSDSQGSITEAQKSDSQGSVTEAQKSDSQGPVTEVQKSDSQGPVTEVQKSDSQGPVTESQKSDSPLDPTPPVEIDTSGMAEVPLVWVFKSGNFQKMYKCRWCPHVNARKINIQEHEKMHRTVGKKGVDPSSYKLKCPDCNYVCNNAGVLSSHAKVHQGFFGEIRSLVDSKRTDAEQIQELQNSLRFVEPEVVISVDDDSENENTADEGSQTEMPQQMGRTNQNRYTFDPNGKALNFCKNCPARFFIKRELRIHSKFHVVQSLFGCPHCSYTAKQKAHLLSHYRVHTEEYQQRTAELVASYPISPENPRLKTIILAKSSDVIEGPVYVVQNDTPDKAKVDPKSRAKYPCNRCPAKFFKSVALQYHLTLHGGADQHRCKYCDYAVKTYGNLMRHQLIHEQEEKKSVAIPKVEECMEAEVIDQEDGDQADGEGVAPTISTRSESWNRRKLDPQFGTLIQGSPEFIYPTYRKNGKIREKRYKCHKCPSAFEKREQYKIHLSLHGSKQKYRCEKCDYSVKYYANYVQHVRKHQSHDEALEKIKSKGFEDGQDLNYDTQEEVVVPGEEGSNDQADEPTIMEQQPLVLQEEKKSGERDIEKKVFWCSHCPYVSTRKDAVDNHMRRHYSVSGLKSNLECMYCDYTATQGNFLKEHIKIHFNRPIQHKVDGYLKCEKMELYYIEDNGNDEEGEQILFFKDNGEGSEERFYPPLPPKNRKEGEEYPKIYVNPETGEIVGGSNGLENVQKNDSVKAYENPRPQPMESVELRHEDLVDAVEEQTEKKPEEDEAAKADAAAKKRWRGKNWKCKKCPHAFNKRDQYLRHASLHGSNQKHNCDLCDYSVKFYTNYVQHMKMHQMHEPNRVILVKKNLKTGNNANKFTKEASSGTEAELFTNAAGEMGYYESDSVMSQVEEKLAVGQCGETDQEYSSLTDATEASASSEDGMCQEIGKNSFGLGPDVSAFVKYETDTS